MSDLPEMLRGAIAEEYTELMRAAGPDEPDDTNACDTKPPDICKPKTDGGTCSVPRCSLKEHAFQPALAGWSTPPALDIR